LLFFYESARQGGLCAVVAIARARRVLSKSSKLIGKEDLDPSVLDASTLQAIGNSKTKTVITFDNVVVVPKPVGLETLREIGCGASHQLLTTRRISDDQAYEIIRRGFP
jgi:GR25 family glycosyltransferase involved in LPS biosynthesis